MFSCSITSSTAKGNRGLGQPANSSDLSFIGEKPTISGFDRKCVDRPKNYIHFWSQRVCLRRYGTEKIYVWLLKRLKPTISGLNRKCVGAPKNNIYFWTQPVRLRRYKSKKIHLRAFEGIKPIISGLNRKCVGGPKNNIHFWTQHVFLR